MKFLNTALTNYSDAVAEEGFEPFLKCFAKYLVTRSDSPISGHSISHVYLSGFIL